MSSAVDTTSTRSLLPLPLLCLWIVLLPPCVSTSDFYYEHWQCNNYLSGETVVVKAAPGKLTELHIRDNIQGEVEIKDAEESASNIRIEIEKTGPSESHTEGVTVNQTLFDVGHGSVFMLQLDYVPRIKRKPPVMMSAFVAGSTFLALALMFVCFYNRRYNQQHPPPAPFPAAAPDDALPPGNGGANAVDERRNGEAETQIATTCEQLKLSTVCSTEDVVSQLTDQVTLTDGIYATNTEVADGPKSSNNSSVRPLGGVGSSRSLSRNTTLSLSILCISTVVLATNCPNEPLARVIVFIPPAFKLDAIKLYFRRNNHNDVVVHHWQQRNSTRLQIFDLQEAGPTLNAPCSSRQQCPSAHIQNLAGCDAATGNCVCERGYDIDRGVCMDVNECATGWHRCPSTATCQNVIGQYLCHCGYGFQYLFRFQYLFQYLCHCGYGFYGDRKTCRPCSVGCPVGTYESSPCSNFADRVCLECTKCQGSTYEAKPCGGISDRQCIHAAHPLLITGQTKTSQFLEEVYSAKLEVRKRKRLKGESSGNVFLEDLHSSRNLETTYYVTDTTQASDFFWDRESRLRVNVGIMDVHLIPEYEDVSHDSDNSYMLTDPNSSEDKSRFRSIMRNYCRHPIPDYYSITLEISRDRTTATRLIECNSQDSTKPRCPAPHKDGDTYLYRTPNDACQKLGTFPEPLHPAANSIVCTDDTALLRHVFNQTFSPEHVVRFPAKKCRTASSRCDQCVRQSRCSGLDVFDRKCCQVDCYTLIDCKLAYSDECTSAPVECAMGDAYRYTIQPVYENIKTDHQCHIRRRRPRLQALYELFYFIQVPGTGFETERVRRTIRPTAAESDGTASRGSNPADFLVVEHDAGLELQEEFVLMGRHSSDDSELVNYTVHPVNPVLHLVHPVNPDDSSRAQRPAVHEISPRIFVASAQFERPFDYSTSTWTRAVDSCAKNTSRIRAPFKRIETASRDVNVAIQTAEEPFRYFLKSVDNPPYIRFSIPGNTSILPHHFRNNGPILYVNDSSFVTSLELTSAGRVWEIRISGRLSFCPGYVGVTVSSRQEQEELLRYDLLILCPAEFNVTFRLPNLAQQNERTFDLVLTDAHGSHLVFLTQLTFDPLADGVFVRNDDPVAVRMVSGLIRDSHSSSVSFQDVSLVVVFSAVAVTTVASLVAFVAVYVYIEAAAARDKLARVMTSPGHTLAGSNVPAIPALPPPVSRSRRRSGPTRCDGAWRYISTLYILVRIIYSLAFTFTAIYAGVSYLVADDLTRLASAGDAQRDRRNASLTLASAVERRWRDERQRLAAQVDEQRRACANYIGELTDALAAGVDVALAATRRDRDAGSRRFVPTITGLVEDRLRDRMTRYGVQLEKFRTRYRERIASEVSQSLNVFRGYLSEVYSSEWMSFPQRLFNDSAVGGGLSRVYFHGAGDERFQTAIVASKSVGQNGFNLTGVEADFGNFIELQEVEEIQLWSAQFWERFNAKFPKILDIAHVVNENDELLCRPLSNDNEARMNTTHPAPLYHLDTTLFFASQQLDEDSASSSPTSSNPPNHGRTADEYRIVAFTKSTTKRPGEQPPTAPHPVFSLNHVIGGVDGDLLRTIFLVSDILVLVYRLTQTCATLRSLRRRFSGGGRARRSGAGHGAGLASASTPLSDGNATTSSRTALTSTSCFDQRDLSNIYTDPQKLNIHASTAVVMQSGSQQQRDVINCAGGTMQRRSDVKISGLQSDLSPSNNVDGGSGSAAPQKRLRSVRSVFGRLVQNSVVPKAIILAVVFVVAHTLLRLAIDVLDVEFFAALGAFSVYVGSVVVMVNDTNGDLLATSKTFNELTMPLYDENIRGQLVNLYSLIDYFNAEQRRLVDRYTAELCAIMDAEQTRWGCELALDARLLNIPIAPCNFIPIEAQPYSGFHTTDYERHLSATFRPFVDSARRVVLTSGYVIVLALTAILAFHVVGWTVCRCLRLRRIDSSRRLLGRLVTVPADSSVQTFIRSAHHDDLDDGCPDDCDDDVDDDDDVSDYDDAADVVRLDVTRRGAGAEHVSRCPPAATTLLTSSASMTYASQSNSAGDFKYSETNV